MPGSPSRGYPLLVQVPGSSHLSWCGEAFGLSIRSAVSLPGLVPGMRPPGARTLDIGLVQLEALAPRPGLRLAEWREQSGLVTLAVDQDEHCYRFALHGAGVFELTADGRRVTCSPDPSAGWEWRRYLMGQVLPFAALLQGLEIFHASAVALEGAGVALAGPTGVGKSTLALNMHLGGAGFVTDDVLAVEVRNGEPVVHPGLGAVKVRRAATDLVDCSGLGAPASSDAQELLYLIDGIRTTPRLATFCMLERSPDGSLGVEDAADPARRLLASTFNLLVDTPERLAAQLDVCATIAREARVLSVFLPDRPDAALAAELRSALSRAAAVA